MTEGMNENIGPQTDPLRLLNEWLTEAKADTRLKEPLAMSLATVDASGHPRARVVLCKAWSQEGVTFFTNYKSRKAEDIDHNPHVAAVFYWDPLAKQVKIQGRVRKVDRAVSEAYWKSRPRESQISQYASQQSQAVASREELENRCAKVREQFEGREIPCPEHWGGYLIEPNLIEFWIGRPGRLHDRYEFERSGYSWTFRRLFP